MNINNIHLQQWPAVPAVEQCNNLEGCFHKLAKQTKTSVADEYQQH